MFYILIDKNLGILAPCQGVSLHLKIVKHWGCIIHWIKYLPSCLCRGCEP